MPGGLLIECEAISLTRDVPAGLGWLVAPVIEEMPRDSLKFTLNATRNALGSIPLKEGRTMNHECEVHMQEAIIADRRQTGFVNPLRVHRALTADIEKRALVWLAERTPAAINSDHLTGLGFVSQLLAGACYALASRRARAGAGQLFSRAQLAGRQPRRHAGARPRAAAPALRFLRRPHGRHLRRAGPDGWGWPAPATCTGRSPPACWRVSTCSPSRATSRPTPWDTSIFRKASSVPRKFASC